MAIDLAKAADRLATLQRAIDVAGQVSGHQAARLLAVSKGQSAAAVQAFYDLGLRDFGESYAQELDDKRQTLGKTAPQIRWHFVGAIQSNKIPSIVRCHLVHSVGTLRHAVAMSTMDAQDLVILLQVNIGEERQKSGFLPGALPALMPQLLELPHLVVRGLMALPPVDEPIVQRRQRFLQVAELRDRLQQQTGHALPELSMGMSDDHVEAVACGATWVRVGTALFGPRDHPLRRQMKQQKKGVSR